MIDQNAQTEAQLFIKRTELLNIKKEHEKSLKLYNMKIEEIKGQKDCQICYKDPVSYGLSCGHVLCKTCTFRIIFTQCPFCKQKPMGYQAIILNRIPLIDFPLD